MALTSSRWDTLEGSRIGAAYEHALRLKAQGREIFDLTTGEPDFDSPPHVCRAGHEAIDAGATKYTPTDGAEALKEAVREKYRRDNGVNYATEEICIGAGAKPLLYYALLTVLDISDEVLIPTPAWASFPGMVELAGGNATLLPCGKEQGYKLTTAQLEAAITPSTKAIIINTPSNPTGAVYQRPELERLGQVLNDYPSIVVIADEIYEHLVYDVEFCCFVSANPSLRERTISINGASKGYAMTGWRIGYAAGPVEIMNTTRKLLSHSVGNPTSISQHAAISALMGPQDLLATNAAMYKTRRDNALGMLNQAPGLSVDTPDGAFYLYVDCAELIGRTTPAGKQLMSSSDFCEYLLDAQGVATVSGEGFYDRNAFRISYACADEILSEACQRIVRACNALS